MTEHSLWRFSRALHRAINDRHFEDIEALIDEDVDWAVYGPIDMFPFLGARQGKAAYCSPGGVARFLGADFIAPPSLPGHRKAPRPGQPWAW